MKSDYLFNGFYGYRNVGDDVFCVVADWGSRKYWGGRRLSFFAKELPPLSQPAEAIIPLSRKYPGHQTISLTCSAIRARHMVYFGGSTLHSRQERWVNLSRNYFVQRLGKKTISAVGVSVGPFNSSESEREIRRLISEMSYISVRDRASFEIVKGMGLGSTLVQSFDPALLMRDVMADSVLSEPRARRSTRKVIGVSVCNVERYHGGDLAVERQRIQSVKKSLKILAAEGFQLRFFVFNGHPELGDDAVTDEVIAALDGYPHVEKQPFNRDPKAVFSELSGCDAVFGVRLHSAILAYTASIPFVLVEYHRKCSDFLDEIGYSQGYRVGDAVMDPGAVAKNLAELATSKGGNNLWGRSVDESVELARVNFTAAPYCA